MTDRDLERATLRRVSVRLLPFLFLLYIFCWFDRSNISIAALQMNEELKLSSAAFGFGAGVFFLSYSLFEVPSNLILARVGARRWLARIAMTWGVLACAMMWVRTPHQLYAVRFLLGLAEAGFFPGVIYYLGQWYPATYRARAISGFMIAVPLSQVLGAPLGGVVLGLTGLGHLSGWQWLFLIEGLPPVLLGLAALGFLTDRPEEATWLPKPERDWLAEHMERERQQPVIEREQQQSVEAPVPTLRGLGHPLLWVLTIPWFAFNTVGYGAGVWTPLLVRDALGTSNAVTTLIVGGIYLLAALVFPLAAALSDRSDDRCGLVALGLAFCCVGSLSVALLPHSIYRVAALVVLNVANPLINSSFWCLPTRFLKGRSAAAGIALISAIGNSGGFFGPSIVGFLKQTSGSDSGAFLGLAGLALVAAMVCVGLRRLAVFRPNRRGIGAASTEIA